MTRKPEPELSPETPDPLASGNIEGQNPATPERAPGHTAYYTRPGELQRARWVSPLAALVGFAAVLLFIMIALLAR